MSKDVLSCPYCGGSGHKDDIPPHKQDRIATLEAALADLAPHASRLASLESALASAKRERDEARKALEPFAGGNDAE